jgi:multiple sugar transport system permease protein
MVRSKIRHFYRELEPWLYIVPSLLLIISVMMVPLVIGLTYAFRNLNLLDPFSGEFIGITHFIELWSDANFWSALRNTALWTGAAVSLQFIFGFILAIFLNRPFPGRGLVQALIFLPWAVPTFLSGLNWAWMFNPVVGPLPYLFVYLGIMEKPENILSDPNYALWGPIIAIVWWGIPFFAITLLAALQSIPKDLYEAAEIDGASVFRRFISITVPFLAPTIAITILLRAIWISNSADLIVVMTRGGPADSTQIVASYIFTQAFQRLDFGYASAIATALLAILLIYSLIVVFLREKLLKMS